MAADASSSSSSSSSVGSEIKTYGSCKATNLERCKTGWPIKEGGLALLCDPCG